MAKSYEVLVTGFCSVVVTNANSEEEAFQFASDAMSNGDFQVESCSIERELTTEQQIAAAKRHADVVADDSD